jgi:serine/threonine protein phosphatase PrpC
MEDSHFYYDNFLQDNASGLFAVLDGHGGLEVVEYATKVLPEVMKFIIYSLP